MSSAVVGVLFCGGIKNLCSCASTEWTGAFPLNIAATVTFANIALAITVFAFGFGLVRRHGSILLMLLRNKFSLGIPQDTR